MIYKILYEKLKEVARKGKESKVSYEDLANLVSEPFEDVDDRNKFFRMLDDINIEEHENERPMITAVVVHKPSFDKLQMPGDGFFKLALDLGKWDGKGDRIKFWSDEIKKVWDYWGKA